MKEIFKNSFGILAGLASIVGVGLIFVRSDYAIAVVCGFYCIAITILAIAIYRAVLKSLVFRNSGKYRRLASFCTFVCDDGKTARFEVARLIQAKVPFLDKIEHKFKWCYGEDARRFLENMKIRRSETPEARAQRLRDLDDFILNRASNFRKTQLLKSNH
jgi:hypothetical protein